MKTLLQTLTLLFFCTQISITQDTITWTGDGDGINWQDDLNWSSEEPSSDDHVVLPSGSVVTNNNFSSIRSLNMEGAILVLDGSLQISMNTYIDASSHVFWNTGFFSSDSIFNQGVIQQSHVSSASFSSSVEVINSGMLIFEGGNISCSGHIINEASGLIDFQSDQTISGTGLITNYGMIQKSMGSNQTEIRVPLHNENTIHVQSGTLRVNRTTSYLMGGNYLSDLGAILDIAQTQLSGNITGNAMGEIRATSNWNFIDASSIDFMGNGLHWISGNWSGMDTVINENKIVLLNNSSSVRIDNNLVLENLNVIEVSGSRTLSLFGKLINHTTASINFMNDGSAIFGDGSTLINYGSIRKLAGTGESEMSGCLHNLGMLDAQSGILYIDDHSGVTSILDTGIYHAEAGAILRVNSSNLKGIHTGNPAGTVEFIGNMIVLDTLNLNFTGTGFQWRMDNWSGNSHVINNGDVWITTISSVSFLSNLSFENRGNLIFPTDGILGVQDSMVNQPSALIEFLDEGQLVANYLDNFGEIRKFGNGSSEIDGEVHNFHIIDLQSGVLEFQGDFKNESSGVVQGISTMDRSGIFVNDGTFSPGNSPGSIRFEGHFAGSVQSVLEIEINGLLQGLEYDWMNIIGNAIFDGSIDLNLNFEPNNGDEFIIATTTGTIDCNALPSMVNGTFNNSTYSFIVDCSSGNSLVLRLDNNLPVDLVEFNVRLMSENDVKIDWHTASENNHSHFVIERSANTQNWTEIGRVNKAQFSGNIKSYEFTDSNPVHRINYYRLKQMDLNGNYNYSSIKSIEIRKQEHINIYPNPGRNVLHIEHQNDENLNIYIYNHLGEQVGIFTNFEIDVSGWENGIYELIIETLNGNVVTQRWIKMK